MYKNDVDFVVVDGCLTKYLGSNETVVIPNGVTCIGKNAFKYCHTMKTLLMSDNVKSIGEYAFNECINLKNITFSSNLSNIDIVAFYGCCSMEEIALPNSLLAIHGGAFLECKKLSSITIPNTITNIGAAAFSNTGVYYDERNWINGGLYLNNCLLDVRTPYPREYEILENTYLIAESVLSMDKDLVKVIVPDTVTYIGNGTFEKCDNLVVISKENSCAHKYAINKNIKFQSI